MVLLEILSLLLLTNANEITINTNLGSITGVIENDYAIFKGIGYSQNAPIGQYRFSESTVRTTPYNNTYNATQFKSICIQLVFFKLDEYQPMDEDCLYLNIWTHKYNGSIFGDSLPVLFWIHGGGFSGGSGSDKIYDGKAFMKNRNVIYVSINYRLGSLGFLALNSILQETDGRTTGGMNGINDIITALQWVQQNINDFGGDPSRVTVFGESAGGIAICMLIATPLAYNLFDKAIIQSGQCIGSPFHPPMAEGLAISQITLSQFNLTDNFDILRALNAAFFKNISVPPSVDNYILTNTLTDIYMYNINESLELNVNELIIGFNSLDSGLSFPFYEYNVPIIAPPSNDNILKQYLNAYIPNSTHSELLRTKYYPINDFPEYQFENKDVPRYELLWASINADVCMICPAMLQSIVLMENNIDIEVYLYNFLGEYPYYIPHGAELSFLFNDSEQATSFWGVGWNYNLSFFYTEMWINYAIYGVPNSTVYPNEWLSVGNNGMAMSIQDENGVIVANYYLENYRNGVCSFWMNEVGMNVSENLCRQSIVVQLEEEKDKKLGIWAIIFIVVGGIILLAIIMAMLCRCCSNRSKDQSTPYSSITNNEMPKYNI